MKEIFSMNWKSFPKCSVTDDEKLGQVNNGNGFLTITIKVAKITLNEVKIHDLLTWKHVCI